MTATSENLNLLKIAMKTAELAQEFPCIFAGMITAFMALIINSAKGSITITINAVKIMNCQFGL